MKNKFVYVVWSASLVIGHSVSFMPQNDMWVFPTYIKALRFVANRKAVKCSLGWKDWRSTYNPYADGYNKNMLVLELNNDRELLRYIVTKAPITHVDFRY